MDDPDMSDVKEEVPDIVPPEACMDDDQIKSELCEGEGEKVTIEADPLFISMNEDSTSQKNEGQLMTKKVKKRPKKKISDTDLVNIKFEDPNPSQDTEKPTLYPCPDCSFQTKYKKSLKDHSILHKNPSELLLFPCIECGHICKRKSDLKQHITFKHGPAIMLQCSLCNFETKHKKSLKIHELTHKNIHEVELFKCEFCEFISKYKDSLRKHHKVMHGDNLYTCTYCGFQTRHKVNLEGHIQVKHEDAELETLYCLHPNCQYQCKRKQDLKKHSIVHKSFDEIVAFYCDQCDFKCKRKFQLRKHFELKHKPKQDQPEYACEFEGCTFSTRYKENLTRHDLIHKEDKDCKMAICEFCSYTTKLKDNMKQHLRTHLSVDQVDFFQCKFCSFKNKHKHTMKRHMLNIHGHNEENLQKIERTNSIENTGMDLTKTEKISEENPVKNIFTGSDVSSYAENIQQFILNMDQVMQNLVNPQAAHLENLSVIPQEGNLEKIEFKV